MSIVMLSAVLYPMLRDPELDAFPLSTYPMFARKHPRTQLFEGVMAVSPDGRLLRPVTPEMLGTGEMRQALRVLQRAVSTGPASALELCRAIAARVASSSAPEFASAVKIAIVDYAIDPLRYADGDHALGAAETRYDCPIPRGAQ